MCLYVFSDVVQAISPKMSFGVGHFKRILPIPSQFKEMKPNKVLL